MDYYGLDPCHCFISPGLSWDAMLKITKIKLDLISDIDMHLFIEKGRRGGISYIAKSIVRQIINTWSVMIVVKKVYTLLSLMQIIYMVRQ